MYYSGFADEAGADFDVQIKATKELGWKYIETRKLFDSNLAFISDKQFDEVCQKLDAAGLEFNCFGSGIANWGKPITEPPDSSYDEMRKAIPRMQKLGIKMVRMMSFALPKELREKQNDYFDEVIKRLKVIVKMAEDGGVICVHENCMNWGSLSYENTLRIFDKIKSKNFKLVFDTGNPVFSDDVRGKAPYNKQSAWEFYNAVKEHIYYVHIKDGYISHEGKDVFCYPGEGNGDVRKILFDLLKNGYDGGFSMEPHMALVFHDPKAPTEKEKAGACANYVEYGRRFMKIVDDIKNSLKS